MKEEIKIAEEKKERRHFFRVDLIRRARCKIPGQVPSLCYTQNISEGGLCLLYCDELRPGTTVETEFDLPVEEPKLIKTHAVVVWQKDYLTGLKFILPG